MELKTDLKEGGKPCESWARARPVGTVSAQDLSWQGLHCIHGSDGRELCLTQVSDRRHGWKQSWNGGVKRVC